MSSWLWLVLLGCNLYLYVGTRWMFTQLNHKIEDINRWREFAIARFETLRQLTASLDWDTPNVQYQIRRVQLEADEATERITVLHERLTNRKMMIRFILYHVALGPGLILIHVGKRRIQKKHKTKE